MPDPPVAYTLSEQTLRKLREDHERLERLVINLRQQFASRRPDAPCEWRVLSGVTATSATHPDYPDETADTYVVQVEKWSYVGEPGRRVISATDAPRTVIARSHLDRYLPEGSRVLVLEVPGWRGVQYYLLDGLAGGAAVLLGSGSWRTKSGHLDDIDVIGPGDPAAEGPRFLAGDPAAITQWTDVQGDGWMVRLNASPNAWLSPTIEIARAGAYEATLTVWMERGGDAWPVDAAELAAALAHTYTDSGSDTVSARGWQDLRTVVRTRLEITDPSLGSWSGGGGEVVQELGTPSWRDTTGQTADVGESTDGSIECERVIDAGEAAAYDESVSTGSATFALGSLSAGARMRVMLSVVRTWDANAGGKLRYCTLAIRQIGNGSGGTPGTFADSCEAPPTTAPPTTVPPTTAPPTTAPPTTAPPTTAPPTTAPPTTAPPTTAPPTTAPPSCAPDEVCQYEWDGMAWVWTSSCTAGTCCEIDCECCPPETAGTYYGQSAFGTCRPVGTCGSPPATTAPPPPPPP